MKIKKVDNSMAPQKAELRRRNLPRRARVLDLFCGNGEMYRLTYKNRVALYHGIDKEKVHDPGICTLINNNIYITHNDMNQYNVFDLDDYGSPWKQIYLILRKYTKAKLTLFVTDGLVLHQNLVGDVSRFVSATEGLPRQTNIPGLGRWYVDIFATMLLDLEKRYGYQTQKAEYFHNDKRTVYYWHIDLQRKSKK